VIFDNVLDLDVGWELFLVGLGFHNTYTRPTTVDRGSNGQLPVGDINVESLNYESVRCLFIREIQPVVRTRP
jgi:hypothetical protein